MKKLQKRSRDERDYELLQSDSGATGRYRVRRVYPSTLRNPTLLRKNAFADVGITKSKGSPVYALLQLDLRLELVQTWLISMRWGHSTWGTMFPLTH